MIPLQRPDRDLRAGLAGDDRRHDERCGDGHAGAQLGLAVPLCLEAAHVQSAAQHWLRRIAVPTLVLWGESDRIVTPAMAALCTANSGRDIRTIAAAGHSSGTRTAETQFTEADRLDSCRHEHAVHRLHDGWYPDDNWRWRGVFGAYWEIRGTPFTVREVAPDPAPAAGRESRHGRNHQRAQGNFRGVMVCMEGGQHGIYLCGSGG